PSAAPGYSAENFEAFGLLACGIHDWNAGDVESGGAAIEQFAKSSPHAPDEWVAELKPITSPYLADYRRYIELRDAAKIATGDGVAAVLTRIEQARTEVKTGTPIITKLEELSGTLKAQ
ncbi:MAG: hypothetical protein ACREKL_14285, partial [Chthoniobacterales bacterium]